MITEYNIALHGDTIEKAAAEFIRTKFSYYESLWKIFIGNKGDNTKADIINYPDDARRQRFSEYSYTVFESAFLLDNIVKSQIFSKPIIRIEDYIEFNKNFISSFAHIGKINDNIIKASDELKLQNSYSVTLQNKLKNLYEARHICIHGKVIPITQDAMGIIQIPQLATNSENSFGWPVREKLWNEAIHIKKEYVEISVNEYFDELMQIINSAYAYFIDIIYSELKKFNAQLIPTYQSITTSINAYQINSIYGIKLPVSSSIQVHSKESGNE